MTMFEKLMNYSEDYMISAFLNDWKGDELMRDVFYDISNDYKNIAERMTLAEASEILRSSK